jgi:hypothetical protein
MDHKLNNSGDQLVTRGACFALRPHFYKRRIDTMRKLHIILSEAFFCPSVYMSMRKNKTRLDQIVTDFSVQKTIIDKKKFRKRNISLRNIGLIEKYNNPRSHAFIIKLNSNIVGANDFATIYRVADNLEFTIHGEEYDISIKPVIHIFPTGIVNIKYSCFFNAKRNVQMSQTLINSFYRDQNLNMQGNNPEFADITSFKKCTEKILILLGKALPGLDFKDAYRRKMSFVNVIQNRRLSETEFRKLCRTMMPHTGDFRQVHLEEDGVNVEENQYVMINPDFSMIYFARPNSAHYTDYDNSHSFYKYLEFAIAEDLIYEFLIGHGKNILAEINSGKFKLIDKSLLKPNYYCERVEKLYTRQDERFAAIEKYGQQVVELYYGGEEKRQYRIFECYTNIEKMNKEIERITGKQRKFLTAAIEYIPVFLRDTFNLPIPVPVPQKSN